MFAQLERVRVVASLSTKLVGLFATLQDDARQYIARCHFSSAEQVLEKRAYLPVGVLVVLTARVARVEAAPTAAEERAQTLVHDVLALDVVLNREYFI